jgi:hypothetical protein
MRCDWRHSKLPARSLKDHPCSPRRCCWYVKRHSDIGNAPDAIRIRVFTEDSRTSQTNKATLRRPISRLRGSLHLGPRSAPSRKLSNHVSAKRPGSLLDNSCPKSFCNRPLQVPESKRLKKALLSCPDIELSGRVDRCLCGCLDSNTCQCCPRWDFGQSSSGRCFLRTHRS